MVFLEYNVSMSHDSEIPLLVNPEEFSHLCSRKTFILFVIAEKKMANWKETKCTSKVKWAKKLLFIKYRNENL